MQVSCVGQMLCAVLAETRALAKRGAAAVKISYEDLPDPIFTIEVRGQADKMLSPFQSQRFTSQCFVPTGSR